MADQDEREPGQGKYGSVVVYDVDGVQKGYAEDMPIFVLLGQDRHAAKGVEAYADALEAAGLDEQALEVRLFSMRLQTWQFQNPERVKEPD